MSKIDRIVIMGILLVAGVFLVCFAIPIGNFLYPPLARPGGGYISRDAEVLQSIVVCHCLGFMLFAAGLAERLAIAISGLSEVRSTILAPSSKPRHAWSLPDKPVGDSGTEAA